MRAIWQEWMAAGAGFGRVPTNLASIEVEHDGQNGAGDESGYHDDSEAEEGSQAGASENQLAGDAAEEECCQDGAARLVTMERL